MVLPLSLISGIWVGSQFLQTMFALAGKGALASGMEVWAEAFFFIYLLCIILYGWGTFHANEIGKESIETMIKGNLSRIFYIGVVGLGLGLPALLTLIMWGGDTNGFLVFLRLASVVAGDLAMRYIMMKSAVYKPLI